MGFVEIDDFVQLQNCFDDLSKSHETLNQNVIMLTELITNFIKMHSPPSNASHAPMPPQGLMHMGNQLAVPPPHAFPASYAVPPPHSSPAPASTHATSMQDTHMVFVEDPTKETIEVLKNLKPLGFKGEDKE